MESYWLAIDERGFESIHQHEPIYNRLYKKWYSKLGIHVNKGFSKLILSEELNKEINKDLVVAVAFEIDNKIENKIIVINVHRIY